MPKASSKKTPIEQFKNLPKQVQKVCYDAAMQRYDKHYHPRNKHHRKHMIADGVLAALLVVLSFFSAYLFLFYRSAVLEQQIDFRLTPQSQSVRSGEEMQATVFVRNNTGQPLANAWVSFPDGTSFTVSSVEGEQLQDGVIRLGTLDPNEIHELTVSGYVLAEVDTKVRLNTVLHFDRSVLLGTAEKLVSETVAVAGSTLSSELLLPEAIVANQAFDFTLTYHNQSPVTAFERVSILPNWPPGWEVLESSVELDPATDFWVIQRVGALEQGSITGRARLQTSDLEQAEIEVKTYISPNGLPLLQEQQHLILPVTYPNVDGDIASLLSSAELGQSISYQVTVRNRETFAINDVRVRLTLNTALFDPVSYPAQLDERSRIVLSLFPTLSPGEQRTFPQSLTLRPHVNAPSAFGNGPVQITLPAEVLYTDEQGQEIVLPVDAAVTQLQSDLSAQAFARYYSAEGDQIGRGPVVPIVGETSKFWVFVHLDNQLHTLTDVNVSGRLPVGVDLTGRESVTEGQPMTFNEGTRFFQWAVGDMQGYQQQFEDRNYGVAFEVAVTPSDSQLGEKLSLLESIEVQGRDSVTGQLIIKRAADVTTELTHDAYAEGDGRVRL